MPRPPTAKEPTPAQQTKSAAKDQRHTWMERIVEQVMRRLRNKPPEQLEQLAASSLSVVARPRPKLKSASKADRFTKAPTRPVEGQRSTDRLSKSPAFVLKY